MSLPLKILVWDAETDPARQFLFNVNLSKNMFLSPALSFCEFAQKKLISPTVDAVEIIVEYSASVPFRDVNLKEYDTSSIL